MGTPGLKSCGAVWLGWLILMRPTNSTANPHERFHGTPNRCRPACAKKNVGKDQSLAKEGNFRTNPTFCAKPQQGETINTMILTRKALSRRTFLRGAGTAVALPFLDAMLPAAVRAQSATAAARPVRMAFVYVPNG